MQNDTHYEQVLLDRIREPSHRLREKLNPERLGELADSIAAEGLHQPIGVRGPLEDGTYEIVWGHRRLLAMQMLHKETITARIFDPDFDPLLAAVSENIQREELSPLEEAHALKKFLDRGEPIAALTRLFRRSASWVQSRLALLDMPEDLRHAVHSKSLSLSVAETLADVDYDDYRRALIAEAQRTGATAKTADIWRAHYLSDKNRIIENHCTVEEIIANREKFVLYTPCEGCGKDVVYGDTRSLRLCLPCTADLREAFESELQRLAHPPTV